MALGVRSIVWVALVFLFAVSGIRGDAGVDDVQQDVEDARQGHLQLQKQVAELESRLAIVDSNLKQARQESIDKSKKIIALEGEVDVLKKRSSGDLKSKLQAAEANVADSAKQVERLEEALKTSEKSLKDVQKKLTSAEAQIEELTIKNEQADKTIATLRKRVRSAEEALKIAEGLMLKAESEAAAKAQELFKVYEAWLPPWAASRLARAQATSAAYWSLHGEPFFKKAADQASQHATTAKEWAKPHVNTLKTNVGPAAKKYWEKSYVAVQSKRKLLAAKASKVYKLYISAHVETARRQVTPRIKVLRDKVRPYIDRAALVIRPHYEQHVGPHVVKLQGTCRDGIKSARSYHRHLEKSVRALLLKHETSAAWAASKEFVTFLALAVVILPAIAMMLVVRSSFSGKKVKKPSRSHNSHKKHRRPKPQAAAA